MKKSASAAVVAAFLASSSLIAFPGHSNAQPSEVAALHSLPIRNQAGGTAAATTNGISYHNGPVLLGSPKVYVIWYGSWTSSAGLAKQAILTDLLQTIGGTPYYNINTTYSSGAGSISNSVSWGGSTTDAYSQGRKNLSDTAIKNIVSRAIPNLNNGVPDINALYFVMTSSDVSKTGFLTQYCGWHTYASISGQDIKYSFVGDPSGPKIGNCSAQSTASPNGDPGADAMASVITHELEEAVTDPDLNAWYDAQGYENADKCAWTFGTTYLVTNGSKANMKLGIRDFLIQQNWLNAGGGSCALQYP